MGTNSHSETCAGKSEIGNERGAALIIVLVMLLLLSILGGSMLATSTSELKISGNYRNSEDTFYTADAAMELAQTYSIIYTNIAPVPGSLWPEAGSGVQYGDDMSTGSANSDNINYNRFTFVKDSGSTNTADVKVEFVGSGNPPAGHGVQEDSSISPGSTSYKANYFAIEVIAHGTNGTTSNLESQLARIVQQ